MSIKTLVFDFDGTIVDSNKLKDRVYFELFPLANEKSKDLIGKISKGSRKTRYQIIREILCALKFEDIEKETENYAQKYGEIVEKGIVESGGAPNAFEGLWFFHNNKYVLYLLSGTPLGPLRQTVEKLVLKGKIPTFKKIYGRVDDKDERLFKEQVIAEIIKTESVRSEEIALIGDGPSERDVALKTGCVFIGISNESNNWKTNNDFPVITDFKELQSLIKKPHLFD